MKLSIVIVNYNVRYFLEQCLLSVQKAMQGVEAEVWLVDNNSADQSVEMVREKFPWVHLIARQDNPGFAIANNQAIKQARGEYILLLNPDTVVAEDCFERCLRFMDEHPDGGALGIKMLDGQGRFLPESKRGLPTPWVAFYKIFGLSSLFPRSPRFARYYMGELPEDENNEVEILAGAFMMMRREALDQAGLLDETFFMYGEDIDLSYRIRKAGFKNYYLAETAIIHYKGESTKKGSLNYVYIFYKAMLIFYEKHFSKSSTSLFRILIWLAIYLRAALSLVRRAVSALALPLFDFIILIVGLHFIKEYWENNHRFVVGGEYSWEMIRIAFPAYAILWILGIFLNGGYEKPSRLSQLLKGVFWGSIGIFVCYSFLSEEYRFSRAILLLGALWAALAIPLFRAALQVLFKRPLIASREEKSRILIVAEEREYEKAYALLRNEADFFGRVHPHYDEIHPESIGNLSELPLLCRELSIDQLIFAQKDISTQTILRLLENWEMPPRIKFLPEDAQFIIGSQYVQSKDEIGHYRLADPTNRRAKRLFDIAAGLILLILSPLILWFSRAKFYFPWLCLQVIWGHKTWISYDDSVNIENLPSLKPGVITLGRGMLRPKAHAGLALHLNKLYAHNYSVYQDINLLLSHFRRIGMGKNGIQKG